MRLRRYVEATLGAGADDHSTLRRRCMRGLTFDMSGSHKWAKPACDCPFDGRVRAHSSYSHFSLNNECPRPVDGNCDLCGKGGKASIDRNDTQ